jgi:quercetin dioxygenase-like cupin family protein
MKNLLILLTTFLSLSINAQTYEYEISSYLVEGFKAPNTNYIGEAWLNLLIRSDESLSYNITKATFKANSTLNWHKHTDRQVLIIVSGKGY